MTAMREVTYSSSVFNVENLDQAKRIILTTEGELTTDQRWQMETPYLLALIESSIALNASSLVLDYGCGVGRMAKALIGKFGCRVVGVDISSSMRALAASYVSSDRFLSCAPEALSWLGVKFDAALAVWALQHCHQVETDIANIGGALNPRAPLFVVNDRNRIVPTREVGWVNDGKDVRAMLAESFTPDVDGELDPVQIGRDIASVSYWATFRTSQL